MPVKIDEIAKLVKGKKCRWCRTPLLPVIQMYEHPGGFVVDGMTEKQWLYVTCNKCDYAWSLRKLRIGEEGIK